MHGSNSSKWVSCGLLRRPDGPLRACTTSWDAITGSNRASHNPVTTHVAEPYEPPLPGTRTPTVRRRTDERAETAHGSPTKNLARGHHASRSTRSEEHTSEL